jgi:hypothetical protein
MSILVEADDVSFHLHIAMGTKEGILDKNTSIGEVFFVKDQSICG